MNLIIDETNLHRTAKYFMDSGRADTHEAAMRLLGQFGLTIHVGHELTCSAAHQTALLTLVNVARRTFLGGIDVIGLPVAGSLTRLAPRASLADALRSLGGRLADEARPMWPAALIGSTSAVAVAAVPVWRVTWAGWRGGVTPHRDGDRLPEDQFCPLAPALAAGVCAAEAFAYYSGDHLMAGRRATGLSLWRPCAEWLATDPTEPTLAYLPSRLWLIGVGNLGQAFTWLLATLPYADPRQVQLLLQDFDRMADSNESTSILSFTRDTGRRKARVVADWLDARDFETFLEERWFGPWTHRTKDEPGVALCGVDNANARAALEQAGFGLVIEAGLGAGPQAFRSISMHTFPASRAAADIWSKQIGQATESVEDQPAYRVLRSKGMDQCGLTRLASRTLGVPFVGLIAGCMVVSELLRRLQCGTSFELATLSAAALEHVEVIEQPAVKPYEFGYVSCGRSAAA
jgi:hypothetical protein